MRIWTEQSLVPVASLLAMRNDENPRRIRKDRAGRLTASLEKFGQVEPLIVNKRTSRLVGGHQRLEIAHAAGVEDLQVTWVDLTEEDEEELMLVLNSEQAQGEWEEDKLATLLGRIRQRGKESVKAAGFSNDDVDRIILRARARSSAAVAAPVPVPRGPRTIAPEEPGTGPVVVPAAPVAQTKADEQVETRKLPPLPKMPSYVLVQMSMSTDERAEVYAALDQVIAANDHIETKAQALVHLCRCVK